MPVLLISCPQCGKDLKLRDRSQLGRHGRCPACRHKFLLLEPDEVELELADPVPLAAPAERLPSRFPEAPAIADPDAPQFPDLAEPAAPGVPLDAPLVSAVADPAGSTLAELRRRRARQPRASIVVGGVVGIGLAAAVLVFVFAKPDEPPPARAQRPQRAESASYAAQKTTLRDHLTLAREASPTDGEPIRLMYVPNGAHVIIHFRPAELWSDEPAAQEFRACLGEPLVPAIEQWIASVCRFPPQEIEELLVCFLLPRRGEPPRVAVVLRTLAEQPKSKLLEKFPGELNEDDGHPLYVSGEHVYLFADDRHTIVIGPNDAGARSEIAESMLRGQPATTQNGLLALLEQTDRERHFTLLFEPMDVRLHLEFLVPQRVRAAAGAVLDWFGEEAETVSWSIHRGDDRFFSQVYLRNQHVWTPTELQAGFRKRVDELPRTVLEMVRRMDPPGAGARMLIGRFPAMMKAYALQTLFAIGDDPRHDRYVQLTTVLPERAAPNLALAALLTWDESTRTDFTRDAPAEPSGPKLPETVAERLQKPIEIDFDREPLEAAFQYIGRETGVRLEVDGKALEQGSLTRNVQQTLSLGTVPASAGIAAILSRYEKEGLCLVVNEPRKTMILTTKAAAARNGQTPFPVSAN